MSNFRLLGYFTILLLISQAMGQEAAFHIHVGTENQLLMDSVQISTLSDELTKPGLLLWTENDQDRWLVLPSDAFPKQTDGADSLVTLTRNSRRAQADAGRPAILPATTQLVQLVGQSVLRGNGFISPPEKCLVLDGRITIRREADRNAELPYPEVQLQIRRDDRPILNLVLDAGEQTLRWADIGGLPATLAGGLPPGQYTLRAIEPGWASTFRVAEKNVRDRILKIPDQLGQAIGENADGLWLQVAVETLLSYREDNIPQPLLADAFDLLDRKDGGPLPTSHLKTLYAEVQSLLVKKSDEGGPESQVTLDATPTGIASIDRARTAINAGQWSLASQQLDAIGLDSDERTSALTVLYRAVILSESGQTTGDAATLLFEESIRLLNDGEPTDQLRALNNYAAFLLNRCQDRIYNHAFQMASGVRHPVFNSFGDWQTARTSLQSALDLATVHRPSDTASIQVNLARLYCTLADLLRIVTPELPAQSNSSLVGFAESWSSKLATTAASDPGARDGHVVAVSEEILAHLAFRQGDFDQSLQHAEKALSEYLDEGSLSGCESIFRLRGLLHGSRDSSNRSRDPAHSSVGNQAESITNAKLVLSDLTKSHLLAEFLRQRMPADQTGSTSAGFFARRAYVNEKMVELLIQLGRDSDALHFAELAKARSLQDVLSTTHASTHGASESDLRANWPAGIVAMEYFIGAERTWLFIVSSDAKVRTFVIRDDENRPIASRDLIARTQRLISGIDRLGPVQGRRIAQSASSGKATYDHQWQHELHWFYNTLVPTECRELLRSAETVVVVPHHILHYFPFAALVTELDQSATELTKMPLPKFFVEEPFCLVNAPSIATWRLLREKANRPLEQVNIVGISDFAGRASNLPGVNTEIANLRAIFDQSIKKLIFDEAASETHVRELLGQPGILTISTHGQKVPDQPLEAFLFCQPDGQHDGYLRAREIYSLDVQADLVLLNACYGGFADRSPIQGDDLFGVQRALLHSGSRTVVSGMWDIYDATAPDIMNDFWKKISVGTAAPQALADAQRNYLKQWREFPQEPLRFLTHPYYWAVFTVTGDDRTGGKRKP